MAKHKMKTVKTAAKRFRVTKTGKIMRNHSNHSHETGKKSTKVIRRLRPQGQVHKSRVRRILRMLAKA
jgi:large subunit ribosomal protein L35